MSFFWVTGYFAGRIATEADAYPFWLAWMGKFTHWFLKSIYWVAIVFFFFASLKYILQVLLSPLLSNLSVAVEKKILGSEPPALNWKETLQDIGRSLKLAIRNFLHELLYCFVLNFVPLVGQVGCVIISAYYYGFGYMDYVLERKRMSVKEAVSFTKKHKGTAIGIGIVMNFMMLIPFVGWIVAPTYATVAATLQTLRLLGYQLDTSAPVLYDK
jgi:CysZ protein